MPAKDLNELRRGVRNGPSTLADALRLARDFGEFPKTLVVIRGIRVTERYEGSSLIDLSKGRLMASSYRPLSMDRVGDAMLAFMPQLTQK